MKKLISIALAIMLIMSLATMAFATEPTNGSITVGNSATGHSYSIYRILKLTTDDPTNPSAFVYTVNDGWADFFADSADPAVDDALNYVNIDSSGAVTWKTGADAAAFAKLALEYAKNKPITAAATLPGTGNDLKFDALPLGYYLVDSTMGALVSLDTTAPGATVEEKNTTPGLEKTVKEGDTWGESNSAKIGDTVEFCAKITVAKGAEGYVLHDKMSDGLTFNTGSVEVKIGDDAVDAANYTVVTSPTDDCTFEVKFSDAYLTTLAVGTKIDVYYSAVLNKNAAVVDGTNDNEASLDFGDESNTDNTRPTDKTETKTYKTDLTKTDGANKVLAGAEFKIYNAATGGTEIAMIKVSEGVYRVKAPDDTAAAVSIVIPSSGTVTLEGFDLSTAKYYLEETVAPAGYNKLAVRQEFEILADANTTANIVEGVYQNGGVQVVNQAGSQLPETGAMGTAIFVSFGTLVVLGTGVLLITKKRMSMIED